ncbi:9270_t:CDS:10 [Diversispora eburnea]|uniref:9270_t:CDS:1 n=1 Tax=Diversispora eburnea TaxID=1213867 RepID=A0A9N8YV95_9GLOM|nr:9270_t:CDS:10 [Diversispora eburnea]
MSSQIPTLLNPDFLTSGLSRGFYEFVNKVGDARSKQEEDRHVTEELASLKIKLNYPDLPSVNYNYITRLIYCDILGHNVDFGHIHAVKLAQSAKGLWEKRVGYLACSLFLDETHELSIMLINTLQKDLQSNNYLEICSALTALCHVLNPEIIPAILKLVEEKLTHKNYLVKKKAIMVFQRLFHESPDLIKHLDEKFRQILTEKEPEILSAILSLYVDFVKVDPNKYKDLVPILINILEQVIDKWLPISYDYHGLPAPWIQMKIIEIMGLLAKDDEKAISMLHPQALSTIVNKSPHLNPLKIITRFLKSRNNNLKYLGLISLSEIDTIWWMEGQWWGEEQMNIIVECLEEKDDSLRKKVLDLLYKMVNSQNVVVIVENMINALRETLITDKFSPGNLLERETIDNVFKIISKDSGGEEGDGDGEKGGEEGDDNGKYQEMGKFAISEAIKILENSNDESPTNLLLWSLRIIGEFSNYIENQEEIMNKMCKFLMMQEEDANREIQSRVITTLLKCVSRTKNCPDEVLKAVTKCTESSSGREFIILSSNLVLLDNVFKPISKDDFKVDEPLSFLNDFVEEALKNGAKPYNPILITREETNSELKIRYEAYEKPDDDNNKYYSKSLFVPHYNNTSFSLIDKNLSSFSYKNDFNKKRVEDSFVDEYEEYDPRKSVVSPKLLKFSSQNWSREGYKANQEASKKPPNSSSVNPNYRTSKKAVATTSINTKSVIISEKERLASALFSGSSKIRSPRKNVVSDIQHDIANLKLGSSSNEFAGFWTKMVHERNEEIVGELVIDNVEIIKQRLENGLNNNSFYGFEFGDHELQGKFRVVEIINNEAIVVSKYTNPNDTFSTSSSSSFSENNLILLHFKLQQLLCTYTIKTDIETILDDVTKELKPYFMWGE